MKISAQEWEELRVLLDGLCDDSLSAEQVERLEQLVLNYPEAEAYYVQYLHLQADLAAHFGVLSAKKEPSSGEHITTSGLANRGTKGDAAEVTSPLEKATVAQPAVNRWSRTLVWSALGLVATAAALAWPLIWWPFERGAGSSGLTVDSGADRSTAPRDHNQELLDDTVAVLLHETGAVWEPTSLPTAPGSPLPPGWLRLKSGLAHIEFYSGATVILEGPAELRIISRMEAFCAQGKLRATVPPQAQGFRIGSPELNVVDRGTEFGLMVTKSGATEVHVFQGKVEFDDPKPGPNHAAYTPLTTGQGIRVDGPGKLSPIELNPQAFQTAEDLFENSTAETHRWQREWQSYCEALRRDPTLLIHFSFDAEHTWDRTLANHADDDRIEDMAQVQGGAIVGCSREKGRCIGRQGLLFSRVSDRVRIHIPGEFNSLTLMAWVRVDSLPNRFNSLAMTDGWDEGEVHWHIGSNGTLELGIQGPNRKSNAHYEAPEALSVERLGQWTHLAVTYNREERVVTHFVDGEPVAQVPLKFDIPLRFGDSELGNWNVANYRNSSPVRNLNGCMDEFMMFSRTMAVEELQRIYRQGRPPQ